MILKDFQITYRIVCNLMKHKLSCQKLFDELYQLKKLSKLIIMCKNELHKTIV